MSPLYLGDIQQRMFLGDVEVVQAGTAAPVTPSGPLVFSTSVLSAPTFPISIRPDGRGYRDALGRPFIGLADTIWNGLSRLTLAEWTTYCQQRREKGYTAILASLLDMVSKTRTQATTGVLPFTGGDFRQPIQTYFDAVKAKLDVAQTYGLHVWLVPGWYGYLGDMWRPNWADSELDYKYADPYADYLAAQFGGRTNIGWLHGGDNNPDTANSAVLNSTDKFSLVSVTNRFASRLKTAAPSQLHTYHTGRTYNASDWFAGQSWYNIDAAYAGLDIPAETITEWDRGRAVMLTEAYYDKRSQTSLSEPYLTRQEVREVPYHSVLTGGFFVGMGNEYVWQVKEANRGAAVWDDPTHGINAASAGDVAIFSRILASFPSAEWMPDRANPLVTSGRGSGVTLAPGMISKDTTSAVIYVPGSQTVTVSLTQLQANRKALWVHPETGATVPITVSGTSLTLATPSGWPDGVILIGNPGGTTPPVEPPAPVIGDLQTLAFYSLTSAAVTSQGTDVTSTPMQSTAPWASSPSYNSPTPTYGRVILALNPNVRSATQVSGYISATLTPASGKVVKIESLQFKAARGGSAGPRGLLVTVVVDGGTPVVVHSADIPTVRATLTTYNISGLALEGSVVEVRIHAYNNTNGATVEIADLTVTGRINGA